MLDRKTATDISISDRIGDRLAEMIATGALKSGDRLTEASLSEMFGCSRVPAREALKVLHAQGILVGERHRGFRVGEFGPVKTRQVLDVRLALEALLVREAIYHWQRGTSDFSLLEAALEKLSEAVARNDVGQVLRCDLAFHRTIAEAARNDLALTLWNTMARYVIILFNLARYGDVELSTVLKRHRAFRDALAAAVAGEPSADNATALLENHYNAKREPGAPVPLN
jgi:DNA-binding GntR family transcriptional regulator